MTTPDADPDLDAPNPHARNAAIVLAASVAFIAWGVAALAYTLTHRRAPNLFNGFQGFLVLTGLVVGVVGLLLLPVYAVVRADARRVELFRREFRAGHYLVRWRYSAESWRAFRAAVAAYEGREWRKLNRALLIIGCGALVAALVIALAPLELFEGGVAAFAGPAAGIAALSLGGIPAAALYRRRQRAFLDRPHPSIVSTIGAYANGKWLTWGTFQHTLHDAKVIRGANGRPLMLELSIRYGQNNFPERILVPAGQEDLAQRVVDAIKQAPAARQGGGAEDLTNILQGVSQIFLHRR